MKLKIIVDYDSCESNAICMRAAPELFRLEDDNTLTVLQEYPPEDQWKRAKNAERGCPRAAIKVVEEE